MPTPSRLLFEEYLIKHAHLCKGLILNVGGGSKPYREYFDAMMINADISSDPQVDIVCSLDYHFPFREGVFDAVLCTSVLEHAAKPRKVIYEIHRVMKTGGFFICYVPFMFPIHPHPKDFWRFTPTGMEVLLEGFSIEKTILGGGKWIILLHMLYESSSSARKYLVPRLFPLFKRLDAISSKNISPWISTLLYICRKETNIANNESSTAPS